MRHVVQSHRNFHRPRTSLYAYVSVRDNIRFHLAVLGQPEPPTDDRSIIVLCDTVQKYMHTVVNTSTTSVSRIGSAPSVPGHRMVHAHVAASIIRLLGRLMMLLTSAVAGVPRTLRLRLLRAQQWASYAYAQLDSARMLNKYRSCIVPPHTRRPANTMDPDMAAGYIYLIYHIELGWWYIG